MDKNISMFVLIWAKKLKAVNLLGVDILPIAKARGFLFAKNGKFYV